MASRAKRRSSGKPRPRARNARGNPAARQLDPFAQRRERFRPMLEMLDVVEAFNATPRRFQEFIWQQKLPDPSLRFDASVPANASQRKPLTREIERNMHEATFEVEGRTLLVRDYFTIIPTLTLIASLDLKEPQPKAIADFIRLAGERANAFWKDQHQNAIRSLYNAVHAPIAAHSRLDVRIYRSSFDPGLTPAKKFQYIVTLYADAPQVQRVSLDGAERPVYRVAFPAGKDALDWISVPATTLPPRRDPGNGRRPRVEPKPLPVFVQSHALRQLRRRLNHPPAVPYLEAWLAHSMSEPVGVKRQRGGDWLVPYMLQERRLGYLVVTPLPTMLVVRTFLFLTMDGTPEAAALSRELSLSRRDVEWLGLADLAAFTQSDLRHDPELRKLFRRCGCEHLFKFDDVDCAPGSEHALAEKVRHYIGLAA